MCQVERWRGQIGISFPEDARYAERSSQINLNSTILRTADDRFIAKELSKPELQTMETFAPAYFDYMSSAITANVGSLRLIIHPLYTYIIHSSVQRCLQKYSGATS